MQKVWRRLKMLSSYLRTFAATCAPPEVSVSLRTIWWEICNIIYYCGVTKLVEYEAG